LITAHTKQSLIDTFQQLNSKYMEAGLTTNEKKTKYIKCTKKDIRTENLNINNLHIEKVDNINTWGPS